jgi:hypothetical protein
MGASDARSAQGCCCLLTLACTHVTWPTQSPDKLRGRPERLMLTTAAPMASPCWHTRLPTKPLPPNTTRRGR